MTNRIRHVFFDAAFTLIQPWPSVGHHYSMGAREFGVEANPAHLDASFRKAWKQAVRTAPKDAPPYGRNREEALELWTRVIRDCFVLGGYDPPSDPRFAATLFYRFEQPECWRVFDDVRPALARLEAMELKTHVLSNFDDRLSAILGGLGLEFDRVIVSSDAGLEKPRRGVFRYAERIVGATPEECLMIGDDPTDDFFGATESGWNAVLIDRETRHPEQPRRGTTLDECVRLGIPTG